MAKHRSALQWASLLEAYRESGLSQVEFCRRKGLSISTFGYQMRRAGTLGGGSVPRVPQLLEVSAPATEMAGRTSAVHIEVPIAHNQVVSIRCECGQVGEILRQIPGLDLS